DDIGRSPAGYEAAHPFGRPDCRRAALREKSVRGTSTIRFGWLGGIPDADPLAVTGESSITSAFLWTSWNASPPFLEWPWPRCPLSQLCRRCWGLGSLRRHLRPAGNRPSAGPCAIASEVAPAI